MEEKQRRAGASALEKGLKNGLEHSVRARRILQSRGRLG